MEKGNKPAGSTSSREHGSCDLLRFAKPDERQLRKLSESKCDIEPADREAGLRRYPAELPGRLNSMCFATMSSNRERLAQNIGIDRAGSWT